MPQINRVRVNNVKYNFGTQFYDDFIMRFNCKNTLYDLANGGGKSLLLLLLMQNMIPNCTLDDKQPIEKLFRQGGGNTCIHSLVEWKLDLCYQEDGYQYMTTGFCARKARNGNDEDDVRADASAAVEYFNYCIFYREFGDNDIRNLALEADGERITYSGLKTYLHELGRHGGAYKVVIFDRKGDYQSFISHYGIFESTWEIIRGINKTEGHVRTYFESNYRTSRKVVEDLFIEEIIRKSFNNRLSVENDEGNMAQTLLDIKDKLVELSKKHSSINAYDSQIAAVNEFRKYVDAYGAFYAQKEKVQNQLYDLLIAALSAEAAQKEALKRKEQNEQELLSEMEREQEAIAIAGVLSEKSSLAKVQALAEETERIRDVRRRGVDEAERKIVLAESANDYRDYMEYEKSLAQIKTTVDNRQRKDQDITDELKQLAVLFREIYEAKTEQTAKKLAEAKHRVHQVETLLNEAKQRLREADREEALLAGDGEHTRIEIAQLESELRGITEEYGIWVVDNSGKDVDAAAERLEVLKKEQTAAGDAYNKISAEFYACRERISAMHACMELFSKQREDLEKKQKTDSANREKIKQIRSVYGQDSLEMLEMVILETYRRMDRDYERVQKEAEELENFIRNAKNGTYLCNDEKRDKLKEYLVSQYGDDVVEGHEWFRQLDVGQKRDVLKRAPFVEYGFIIKNDFERVKADETLSNYGRGSVVYPIISEQVLIDTKLEVNKDIVLFALKDMSFLRDDTRLETEIRLAQEELDGVTHKKDKLYDRKSMVWADYTFVLECSAVYKDTDINRTIEELVSRIDEERRQSDADSEKLEQISKRRDEAKHELTRLLGEIDEVGKKYLVLQKAAETNKELTDRYAALKEVSEKQKEAKRHVEEIHAESERRSKEYEEAAQYLDGMEKRQKAEALLWETDYAPYYVKDVEIKAETARLRGNESEISARFMGLRNILTDKNQDAADKESLMRHLQASMKKCSDVILYRGFTLQQMRELMDSGQAAVCDTRRLRQMKEAVSRCKEEYERAGREFESQQALRNRLEGSIAHAVKRIEEQYGEFREFSCDNPEQFIIQHKAKLVRLKQDIESRRAERKAGEKRLGDIQAVRKDLERIGDADLCVPMRVSPEQTHAESVNLDDYESVQKEYASLIRAEYKKVDEFAKNKQRLIDLLIGCDAQELANEIKLSVNVPDSAHKAKTLSDSLAEMNTFIELEKNRIQKGIEDMERIKDNFENRCIQICSNIKSELDRLPKLSRITMDNEQISIVSQQIPYVHERLYKERMSAYIDETVMMAESFRDGGERLRYIRGRLAWKRLFSVIVTDMNAIRINLYKRERIKDQSRYLRYEEAVGSTGQSQGIYIQFLIAVINYIASMNTKVTDGGIVGKTIFIDNPFGAAKDIYIWEPIFELLRTNHVQLIVPARGATPAITGRFEVNYVLGQKLADKRQQTVVVDYYSSTKESELEYTRMEYEQTTFDFI